MAQVVISQERTLNAPANVVYECLANYREHHPKILPAAFHDLEVVEGGIGAGTVIRFKMTVGGRTRSAEMIVSEPEPGRVMVETGRGSTIVTTFTVNPSGGGCVARIETRWDGASGIGGVMERFFAGKALRKIFAEELELLEKYARARAS